MKPRHPRRPWTRLGRLFPFVLVLCVASPAGVTEPSAAATPLRPNVLIFVTDDQRVDTMSVMPRTRALFNKKGTRFTSAFATTPLCCPARASIFTGQYAHNHGVRVNADGRSFNQEAAIQRYLQDRGYRTALVGKYLNAWDLYRSPQHFDEWALFRGDYYNVRFNVNGAMRTVHYSTDYIARRTKRILRSFEETDRRPWFVYVAPSAPHPPATPENDYRTAAVPPWRANPAVFEGDRTDKPPWVQEQGFTYESGLYTRERQLRSLMSVDDLVSGVFERLSLLGETRRTLAFFISDNGYFLGEHGLRGKSRPYTPAVKIPLFMRWPRHVTEGATDDRFAANIDLAPTILDAARISPDPSHPMDGRSLLRRPRRDHALLEFWAGELSTVPDWASLRTRTSQYVEYYDESSDVVYKEFYDVASDPWQLLNLLGDADPDNDPPPEVLSSLHRQLATERVCVGTQCP